MSRFPQKIEIDEPIINLTPLIDVVFVILIMFIVVAPLLELDEIALAGSGNDSKTVSINESSPITIHVKKDNSILFNNRPLKISQLPDILKIAKQQFPNTQPMIFHDKRALFGTYQAIKNAAENAGFEQMDIVLRD